MKTVALLSGGKDSVFNLLHCVLNGHEPVAVASLGPPEGKDELDSFMYQTVGHSGLATIAEALELPFFSHTIRGTAVNVGGEYGSRSGAKGKEKASGEEGDETEDLYSLLFKVKQAMPDVQAVAAGAILSNYQRVRVEHVCQRLGLTPLAFLWEREQRALLSEMVEAGMESVLVKVAGAGLQVEHLGKTLAEMQPTLHRLNARYQLHICGEGGEYETFTVDCPLYKRRVIFDKTTTIISDPNPFATIAHLHLDAVSLGPRKPFSEVPENETFEELQTRVRKVMEGAMPHVMEERAAGWMMEGEKAEEQAGEEDVEDARELDRTEEPPRPEARTTADGWIYFSEVVAGEEQAFEGEIEDEVRACFGALEELLASNSASLLTLTHLTVLLSPPSSMALFPRINAIYASYFGTSPPTRACVAVAESGGRWRVKLEGVARRHEDAEERKALHVQSLSYWAAANIGPYSQAVKTSSRLYIAGQIPLIPVSLTLPPSSSSPSTSFSYHASLSLQHLRRIVDSAAPSWSSPSTGSAGLWEASEREYLEEQGAEEERNAPFLAVEAGCLPKEAEVEWQATWAVPSISADDEDGEDRWTEEGESWARSTTVSNDTSRAITWQCSASLPSSPSAPLSVFAVLGCSLGEKQIHPLPGLKTSEIHSIRAFYRPSLASVSEVSALATQILALSSAEKPAPAMSFVPVGRVATLSEGGVEENEVAFVLVAAPARA
ncbi:hypothetical protein JCM10213v2_008077 [Rhodosporidiobolus nylandii]